MIGRSSVPEEASDTIERLSAETTITRDQYGITYISADNENDAMAALGYAHAQDRLWQMELTRRAAAGRLSEIFGSRTLLFDKFMRNMNFAKTAGDILKSMPKKTIATLEAYSRGVNAYITSHRGRYPMEFDALGYQPEPWKPEHSILISRIMAWQLNPGLYSDIIYANIREKVDSVRFREILPYNDPDEITIIGSGQTKSAKTDTTKHNDTAATTPTARNGIFPKMRNSYTSLLDLQQDFREFTGFGGSGVGSNAWTISANRTQNGKPILANDPHLQLRAPAQWYQAIIITKNNTLAGMTLAGAPFVVIGRNKNIAWGITSLMGDETDYFIEELDSAKKKTMLRDEKWVPVTMRRDTILVKDSAAVPIVIRSGVHGPFVSDIHPLSVGLSQTADIAKLRHDSNDVLSRYTLAVRWNGTDPTQELAAWQGVNNASNFSEFKSALSLAGCPSLSFVYADRTGNIGYVPVMRVPIREATNPNLPNPGWDSRYDWKGYAPMNQLPTMYNPPSGYVATANNRLANNLPHHISDVWEDQSRAERLEQFLVEGKSFTTLDVGQMQLDVISPFTNAMLGYLLNAFPDSAKQGSAVRQSIAMIYRWNGAMTPDAPEASIANEWLTQVLELTYKDEMGDALYAEFLLEGSIPARTLRRNMQINSRWFDNVKTPNIESRDDILREAFGKTMEVLHNRYGTWDPTKWRYGTIHTITFHHAFSQQTALQSVVDIGPFEIGGNSTTLNKGEWSFNHPYEVKIGPSMRMIVDFSDTTAYMRSIIPTGASGQPLDPFYKNQTTLWLIGGLLAMQSAPPTGAEAASVTRLSGE